jgi:hypothetical protein
LCMRNQPRFTSQHIARSGERVGHRRKRGEEVLSAYCKATVDLLDGLVLSHIVRSELD